MRSPELMSRNDTGLLVIDVQTKLATCLREGGNLKKAVQIFNKNKSRASRYAPYWIALGVTHYASGNNKKAKSAWERAIKIEPRNKTAQSYRALTR